MREVERQCQLFVFVEDFTFACVRLKGRSVIDVRQFFDLCYRKKCKVVRAATGKSGSSRVVKRYEWLVCKYRESLRKTRQIRS